MNIMNNFDFFIELFDEIKPFLPLILGFFFISLAFRLVRLFLSCDCYVGSFNMGTSRESVSERNCYKCQLAALGYCNEEKQELYDEKCDGFIEYKGNDV